jgi:hypothetical protein
MGLLRIVSRIYVSRRKIATFALSAFITGIVLGALLLNFGGIPSFNALPQFTLVLSDKYMGRGIFSATLPEITIQVNAPQYHLPVYLSGVRGYDELKNWLHITPEQEQLLSQNGFVVLRINGFETLADFYECALNTGMPILITTDAVLHTYHVLFDETLKRIEMNELIDTINATVSILLAEARNEADNFTGSVLEGAARLNLMYLEVAHALMQPDFAPSTTKAKAELQLISNHSNIAFSPIFGYEEDYTQYVPRGHYTENEQLKAYFKTMMWLGRMRFALLTNGVIDVEQTRAAILLTWMINNAEGVFDAWQRVYEITKFFVGVSDDLTFEDYSAVLNENEVTSLEQIRDESMVASVAQELLNRNKAKILGTYAVASPPQEHELQRILNETSGLRFMGQRFIPDSYMFQQLVFTQVGNWALPRLLPKGLDVPAVLGSGLAKQILDKTEAVYENYTQQMEKLRAEFKTLSVTNWTRNLYWSWLYTANTTLAEIPSEANYPTFMTTSSWGYEKLQTFEGTWTELRHDTILYAKQSYTPFYGTIPPSPFNTAYVEPYPEAYRRLTALINMTISGLTQLELLLPDINTSLTSFIEVSKLFLNASIIELEGKTLDKTTQQQIRSAAKTISAILSVASEKTQKAAIVADVHTDTNTERVLEEALGNFNALVVVYADADGSLYAAAGPAYNYFEFTQPMSQRLTDEEWREMLETSPQDPPEWTDNFAR